MTISTRQTRHCKVRLQLKKWEGGYVRTAQRVRCLLPTLTEFDPWNSHDRSGKPALIHVPPPTQKISRQ